MIYLSGSRGLIGSRFMELCDKEITPISYRDEVPDIFDYHEESCLIHLAWSSTTRIGYEEFQKVIKNDVENSKKLFDFYVNKNPNGKIIFVSSAGDLHLGHQKMVSEEFEPSPHSLYGQCKLYVEDMLNQLCCNTIVFRASNIWGANVKKDRVNGLVDKLLKSMDTNQVVEIFANLKTKIDLIHVDDFVDLLLKAVSTDSIKQHDMFLVGRQSISISDIIDIISKQGTLNLKINQKAEKTYLQVETSKVRKTFNWEPKHILK